MIKINKNQEKNVSLKIRSLVVDPQEIGGTDDEIARLLQRILDDDTSLFDDLADLVADEARDEIELCTEAVLRMDDAGCVEIEYYENPDDEQMRTLSKIIFYQHAPEIVSMIKEGAMQAYLSFEAGKTHVCTYDTPFMTFKIYVDSKAVDNRLLDTGHLHLNYVLNFGDNPPQHFILDIDMKEEPSAC